MSANASATQPAAPLAPAPARSVWPLMIAAAAVLMITMGARQTTGLFVSPINTTSGLGIVSISFALAIGQFVWGASQPVFGIVGDKFGAFPVVVAGALLMAAGLALTPQVDSQWGLIVSMGVMMSAGAGAGSFSTLIGAASQRLPMEKRSFAAGFINAGGSFGQFVFAPVVQMMILALGWMPAMYELALITLLTIPLAWALRPQRVAAVATAGTGADAGAPAAAPAAAAAGAASPAPTAANGGLGLVAQLRVALRDRSYLCLHAGFFTCGFHIAFLVTHLPGEVQLCSLAPTVASTALALIGLFNIAGSLSIGVLGQRYRMKHLLALMYASRAVAVALYLVAPKTAMTFYVFAAVLGFTWLATVPPTAGLVGKLFGTRYLATLFGLTLLSHQIGGFLGAWLGGVSLARDGNFDWMWYADIVLALAAALVNLPIREAHPRRPAGLAPA